MPYYNSESKAPEPPPEQNPFNYSIGKGATNKSWSNTLEEAFGLPFKDIAKAAGIAFKDKITIAQAIEIVKKEIEANSKQ